MLIMKKNDDDDDVGRLRATAMVVLYTTKMALLLMMSLFGFKQTNHQRIIMIPSSLRQSLPLFSTTN